jgi:hypothetical protein
MTMKYEVTSYRAKFTQEYDTLEEAEAKAETFPRAEIISWNVSRNLPNAKPDFVYRSCAVRIWEDGKWRGIDITR